jgi:hypothetical protein
MPIQRYTLRDGKMPSKFDIDGEFEGYNFKICLSKSGIGLVAKHNTPFPFGTDFFESSDSLFIARLSDVLLVARHSGDISPNLDDFIYKDECHRIRKLREDVQGIYHYPLSRPHVCGGILDKLIDLLDKHPVHVYLTNNSIMDWKNILVFSEKEPDLRIYKPRHRTQYVGGVIDIEGCVNMVMRTFSEKSL